tara:strand:+ start:3444 stop:3938 length:495 start_codon:yes stop_codon:yes gene_type:complete
VKKTRDAFHEIMYILYIQPTPDMVEMYTTRVVDHTMDVSRDAGFDMLCKESNIGEFNVIRLGAKCAAYRRIGNSLCPTAFYMYPRSSISNTPLRLANSVGVIDAGYRGELLAKVDNMSGEVYNVPKGRRLFQVCMPDLLPFRVEIVASLDITSRGDGAFGSTGL